MTKHKSEPCPHCGLMFDARNLWRHEAKCPRNPECMERMRAWAEEWAEGDAAPTSDLYADLYGTAGLPHPVVLRRVFGGYAGFVEWLGYPPIVSNPQRRSIGLDPETMPGSIMADDTMHHDPSCLRCEPVQRPVRAWQPHAHAWVVVGMQTAWQVR